MSNVVIGCSALDDVLVADTVSRENVSWVRRVELDLLSEFENEIVDRAGGGKVVVAPYVLKKLFSAHNRPGALIQIQQYLEFAMG